MTRLQRSEMVSSPEAAGAALSSSTVGWGRMVSTTTVAPRVVTMVGNHPAMGATLIADHQSFTVGYGTGVKWFRCGGCFVEGL